MTAASPLSSDSISAKLEANEQALQTVYRHCKDVKFRSFTIGETTSAFIVYIEGLINIEILGQLVLAPLLKAQQADWSDPGGTLSSLLSISDISAISTISDAVAQLSNGSAALFIDQVDSGLAFGLANWQKRSIEEPAAESIIRGPREGFTETMTVNTAMLRRKIKSTALKMVAHEVGQLTKTEVVVAYIENIAAESLIAEVRERIDKIDIDGILESGYIEGFIEDHPFSPFPQIQVTERPDVVSAALLEGRVAILTDGTPIALIAPATLFSLLQSPEDYYQRFMIGTLIRWLRYFFFGITLLLPSAYVAILTFHQEMVPTSLLLSIAKSREDIPFPALIEALLMEISFEALREAGVRLPKQVGAAVSIVGALVIGQAATSAGLVSAPMVMVVAITGIASFMIPQYSAGIALRMLRFPIMFLAGMFGLLGLVLGFISVVIHLCSLRSMGVPYMQPVAPMKLAQFKDVLVRAPIWRMRTRPRFFDEQKNRVRQPAGQRPTPPKGKKPS